MGTTTFSGPVVSNNGFVGDVTGDVTGNVTGNLNGTVGATTPAAGTFTSVTSTGNVTADSATAIVAGGASSFLATSTAGFGIYFGSGAPTVSAAKGSLYLRSDGTTTNDRAYINTDGATTWTALTTAA